jgi:hypothetical protein
MRRMRRRDDAGIYRMYFWFRNHHSSHMQGREDFKADDDVAAIRIACILQDACSDVCDDFELWQGPHQILMPQARHQIASLDDLSEAHLNLVIEKEEHISQSRWLISRSRRLIEELDRAKSVAKRKFG